MANMPKQSNLVISTEFRRIEAVCRILAESENCGRDLSDSGATNSCTGSGCSSCEGSCNASGGPRYCYSLMFDLKLVNFLYHL